MDRLANQAIVIANIVAQMLDEFRIMLYSLGGAGCLLILILVQGYFIQSRLTIMDSAMVSLEKTCLGKANGLESHLEKINDKMNKLSTVKKPLEDDMRSLLVSIGKFEDRIQELYEVAQLLMSQRSKFERDAAKQALIHQLLTKQSDVNG